jgi:Uma2 family endonuclease
MVLWPQNPLVILPDSETEPDIILLAWRDDFYRQALPGPQDVALLIEVAGSSLRYDRRLKGPLYAEAGVRDYWIVDLEGDAIKAHRNPRPTGFQRIERIARGASVAPLAFPQVTLAVSGILG